MRQSPDNSSAQETASAPLPHLTQSFVTDVALMSWVLTALAYFL